MRRFPWPSATAAPSPASTRTPRPPGIEVLRKGGNAVDAAVATAAALGVTEPYSAGVGGGGYFVYYDAKSRTVRTIDGRETAPLSADENLFTENGKPLAFADAVSSGLSVGTPGTPATWQTALRHVGQQAARQGPEAGRADRPRRLHRRRHLPLADGRPTRPASATSRTPPTCSCRAASSPSSAPPSRTPTSPAPTRSWDARASARSTAATSAGTSSTRSTSRPSTRPPAGTPAPAI